MPKEGEPIRLTDIHINLVDQVVTIEAEDGRKARYSFAPTATIFEASNDSPTTIPMELDEPEPTPTAPPARQRSASTEQKEKEPTVTLAGKLLTKPRPGKPDNAGKATAWARFAAHEEGNQKAHLYSTTFHRSAANIALQHLDKDSSVVLEGYSHPAGDPKRMDTFSVVVVHQYPGKPERSPGRRR